MELIIDLTNAWSEDLITTQKQSLNGQQTSSVLRPQSVEEVDTMI